MVLWATPECKAGGGVFRLHVSVGPEDIRRRAAGSPGGAPITSAADLAGWVRRTGQEPNSAGLVAVTFVVDEQGRLLVADRRSEHVACSSGRAVLSAGELFLAHSEAGWRVVEVTNQSTGFCPEPESWPAVASELDRAGVPHPGRFTAEVVFRRCGPCGQRNVVKGGWFACDVCGAELPAEWNFAAE
jgi:hypothetical protein